MLDHRQRRRQGVVLQRPRDVRACRRQARRSRSRGRHAHRPALANRIGVPEAADWEVADIAMNTQVFMQGADDAPDRVCTSVSVARRRRAERAGRDVPGRSFHAGVLQYDPVGCRTAMVRAAANDGIVGCRAEHRRCATTSTTASLQADRSGRSARHEHARSTPATSPGTRCSAASAELQPAVQERSASVPDLEPVSHQRRRQHRADRPLGRQARVPDDQRRLPGQLQRFAFARPRLRRHLRHAATTTVPDDMGPRSRNRAGRRHLGPLRLDLGSAVHRHAAQQRQQQRGRSACRCTSRRSIPPRMPARPT